MASPPHERSTKEFVAEAQELCDALGQSLLALDQPSPPPEVLNEAFRAAHSLKGSASVFGLGPMTAVSHGLESALDAIRLGRLALSRGVVDALLEAVAVLGRLVNHLAHPQAGADPEAWTLPVLGRMQQLAGLAESAPTPSQQQERDRDLQNEGLDSGLLSVLTEYEEHRLRERIRQGRPLCRVRVGFELDAIEDGLERLRNKLKQVAEVISFLPSSAPGASSRIELDVLIAALRPLDEIRRVVESEQGVLEVIERREPPARAVTPVSLPTVTLPSPPSELARTDVSLRSVAQTVRVDIRRLDHLMNVVGDLQLVKVGFQHVLERLRQQRVAPGLERDLATELRALGRRVEELQAGILEVRMVPLGQIFDKLSRVVRKISRDAGKEIRLVIAGGDTELDKLLVEELSDPLMHVIRNGIDHGIEHPEVRRQSGKNEQGTLSIRAEQRGNHVLITVTDDGAGIDRRRLVERAIERHVLDASQASELSDREVLNLVFQPGLSTKEVPDEVSGRGVGMDVVKTNIARLSGIIDLDSQTGVGTTITITLPITLAILPALIVKVAGRTYAVPLNSVLESLRISPSEVGTIERREVMSLRGQTLPLERLDRLFRLDRSEQPRAERQFVVVVGLAQHRVGLIVDELVGQQNIVIKSLGRLLGSVPGVAGATELGGRRTVLVLDVAGIVEESITRVLDDTEAA